MAIIYAQDVFEIAMHHEHAGRPVVNVLHIANDEGAQSDASKARDVLNNWQDHMISHQDDNLVLVGCTWRSLDPDDTNQGEISLDPAKPTVGAYAGMGAPPNVALLIKKVTANRQRGQRDGRMFLGGVPVGTFGQGGDVLPDYRAAKQTACDAFLDGVNDDQWGVGGGSGLVVLNTTPESRTAGSLPVTLTWRPVTSLIVDSTLSTQRDRLR